jgi:uncharacterized damage-inducible protein DinB
LEENEDMPLVDALLPEFDHEMTTTRKLLERIPDDRLDWKPHTKSMTLGGLGTHLSNLPNWGKWTLEQSEFDLEGVPRSSSLASRTEILAAFDQNVTATRYALNNKTDAELMAPWMLKHGGRTLFTLPKAAVLRSFLLNHIIHHRGQLSVYLRLQDVPVPSIYGPSADEGSL